MLASDIECLPNVGLNCTAGGVCRLVCLLKNPILVTPYFHLILILFKVARKLTIGTVRHAVRIFKSINFPFNLSYFQSFGIFYRNESYQDYHHAASSYQCQDYLSSTIDLSKQRLLMPHNPFLQFGTMWYVLINTICPFNQLF